MTTSDETDYERGYIEGARRAHINALRAAIVELRGAGGPEEIEAQGAAWILERQETIAILREVCTEFGGNDWADDLHLRDVIEKHLLPHLAEMD